VSSTLSPIFYLFLAPFGKLYLKVHHLLVEDELLQRSNPPLLKRRRPGPKHPYYGIPTSEWPTLVQRMVEQKESLRTVAAAFGVSHETIRRIVLHVQKQHRQKEA
jgi:hypothetical protein